MPLPCSRKNPYILCSEQFGLPFGRADELAAELGIDEQSPIRLDAAILYELRFNMQNGHAFIPEDKLPAHHGAAVRTGYSSCHCAAPWRRCATAETLSVTRWATAWPAISGRFTSANVFWPTRSGGCVKCTSSRPMTCSAASAGRKKSGESAMPKGRSRHVPVL